jgi:hypothetical protein
MAKHGGRRGGDRVRKLTTNARPMTGIAKPIVVLASVEPTFRRSRP